MYKTKLVRGIVACATFTAGVAVAQTPDAGKSGKAPQFGGAIVEPIDAKTDAKKAAAMQKMMEAWQKFATPGPEHQQLKAMTGTWSAAVKMWMDPKAPPQESVGTANAKMILNDRYQLQEWSGTMMGEPFSGWNITGFDNGRKKWVMLWIDSMGTGFYVGEGTADKTGKVITYQAEGTDPMTGKASKARHVMRFESDTRVVTEMFERKGGKEVKMMEIVYTKK